MRLIINNIGKVRDANIEMNGITVLAGENDTGKSTISKSLYSVFSPLFECESKIDGFIKDAIYKELFYLYRHANFRFSRFRTERKKVLEKIMKINIDGKVSAEDIYDILEKSFLESNEYIKIDEELIGDVSKTIAGYLKSDREMIKKTLIQTCLEKEFSSQINNLYEKESAGIITLIVKDKEIRIEIRDNKLIDFKQDIELLNDVTYLDEPMSVDDYEMPFYSRGQVLEHNENALKKFVDKNKDVNIVDDVMIDGRLTKIMSLIDSVVNGKVFSNEGELSININGMSEPINIKNLASGIKSLLTIKTIIMNGYVKDKSVLILDEPETHLHPKWQMLLASFIVQLQKEFNITCLISTHSPYFLNSIEVFSDKENISDRCKYYLSEKDKGVSDVTFSTERIYKILSDTFDDLDKIQDEE